MNLSDLMTAAAARHGDRTAIRQDGVSLSYTALERATGLVAGLLREHDVQPGDRVGVMLPNVVYFPICYYGALRAGAAIVPMNMLLKEREVAYYMADSGARVLFAWHTFAEAARAGAGDTEVIVVEPGSFEALLAGCEPAGTTDRNPDDTAVILYTSGTTGHPKGAELTHGNLSENVAVSLELFELGPDAVMLGALPLFHAFGQTCALNATMAVGGSLSLLPRFDAGTALEIIERDRATVFEGVPTMYAAMLHHPEPADTSSLQPVRLRRRGDAGRGAPRIRAEVRVHRARGLRAVGDLSRRRVQQARSRAQAGLDRASGQRRRDATRGRPRRRR